MMSTKNGNPVGIEKDDLQKFFPFFERKLFKLKKQIFKVRFMLHIDKYMTPTVQRTEKCV